MKIRLFLKLLKYLFLAIALIITAFLIYNYFRTSSEDIIEHIKTDIKEGMPANEMQDFLNKHDFVCEKNNYAEKCTLADYEYTCKTTYQPNTQTCKLYTTSVFLLGSCEHHLSFRVKNNKASNLDQDYLCVGL